MGKRNWLFASTEVGARRVGIIQSLLVTCRLHSVDPYTYLVDVLQRISEHPAKPSTNSPHECGSLSLLTTPCLPHSGTTTTTPRHTERRSTSTAQSARLRAFVADWLWGRGYGHGLQGLPPISDMPSKADGALSALLVRDLKGRTH